MTELTKLVIEVAGKKLEFTPEEAKELKKILSDLFGGEKVIERIIERNYGWHWWQPSGITYEITTGSSFYQGNDWTVKYNAADEGVVSINCVSSNLN